MSLLTFDGKNRVLLDSKIRKMSGLRKGARLVAIPIKGGVILVDASQKSFVESLKDLAFNEKTNEASKRRLATVKNPIDILVGKGRPRRHLAIEEVEQAAESR